MPEQVTVWLGQTIVKIREKGGREEGRRVGRELWQESKREALLCSWNCSRIIYSLYIILYGLLLQVAEAQALAPLPAAFPGSKSGKKLDPKRSSMHCNWCSHGMPALPERLKLPCHNGDWEVEEGIEILIRVVIF